MQTLKKNNDIIDDYKEKIGLYEMNVENLTENIRTLDKEKEDLILEKSELHVQLHNQRSKVSDLEIHKNEIESKFKIELNNLESKLKSSEATILDKESKVCKCVLFSFILSKILKT